MASTKDRSKEIWRAHLVSAVVRLPDGSTATVAGKTGEVLQKVAGKDLLVVWSVRQNRHIPGPEWLADCRARLTEHTEPKRERLECISSWSRKYRAQRQARNQQRARQLAERLEKGCI